MESTQGYHPLAGLTTLAMLPPGDDRPHTPPMPS